MPQLTEQLTQRTAEPFAAPDIVKGNEHRIATGLGWFSIGLGAAELLFPRQVARVAGSRNHATLLRIFGIREIGAGIGILASRRNPAPWLWARVAGDMLDLASLGSALQERRNERGRTIASIVNVAGITALDVVCAQRLTAMQPQGQPRRLHVRQSIAIDRSPDDLYNFWRDFRNLPRVMKNIERIEATGDRRAHWVLRTPIGRKIEWDAELEEDRPGELIAWRTTGGDIEGYNAVRFETAPQGHGTFVKVDLHFTPPAFAPAKLVKFFSDQQIRQNLRRFKQLLETGEIATTEGQPSGRRSRTIQALKERTF